MTRNLNIEKETFRLFRPFAEKYARAMDSSWYKRAVDQHSIEPDSFVFSVPFNAGTYRPIIFTCTIKNIFENCISNYHHLYFFFFFPSILNIFYVADSPNPLVTATHAVFIGTGHKAPAAVVGLQFQHSSLASRFVNITSTVNLRQISSHSSNFFSFIPK